MIQDLDMMYPPQDRLPAFPIKEEHNMGSRPTPQPCAVNTYSMTYGSSNNTSFGGEWPADLDNIHLDCSLPAEAESPLKLEDYSMTKFVFVDPSTQSPSPAVPCSTNTYHQSPACSTTVKYSSPQSLNNLMQPNTQPNMYYEPPAMVAMDPLQPEITQMAHSVPGQCQGRPIGRRGRPRTEWRINKRGPGRPRAKPGRKPTLGIVKSEPDDEENMFPDVGEEKRERRREQNRRAARKLREKKKVHVEHMKENYEHVLSENRRLSGEVAKLKKIVTDLKSAQSNHVCICNDTYTASPSSANYASPSSATYASPSSVISQATSAYVSGSDSGGSYHEASAASLSDRMNDLTQMDR